MGTQVLIALLLVTQTPTAPVTKAVSPVVTAEETKAAVTKATPVPVERRCDARAYQYLMGRTVSDLLTAKLPKGTLISRLDDPPQGQIAPGRLSIELNRSTRVRRVYCS
ncbi:MAG: hypothetical protein RLZZ157_1468 [Pseudomonadota bacterium]|jgi:hypothetical protein